MQDFEAASELPMDDMQGGEVVPFPMAFVPPEVQEAQRRVMRLVKLAQLPNVADVLDEQELAKIGPKVVREYKIDRDSRKDWEDKARRAMDIAKQVRQAKNTPWENASNIKYPLLTTSALQFGARAYPAIVDGERVVKCKVMGSDPQGMKSGASDRVSEHMSYQLLHETDWESDVDTMVHMLPVVGCCFKKVYADGFKEAGFCDELVSAFDFVVNQKTKSLNTVPRATHVFQLYPHEIAERVRAGTMLDVDLKGEGTDGEDDDAPHMLLEQHRYLDLDGDGVLEPWIVTVHERTEKVLKIKPGYDPDGIEPDMQRGRILRIKRKNYFVKIPFIPDPNGGFYDLGFGHLLGDINEEIDTAVNQMNDAATMQNAGGGFIGGGIDLGKGKSEYRLSPGVYRTVSASGDGLAKNIVPFSHPGPSKTTLDLLTLMIEAGKDISGVQDIMVGDQKTNQTATTTLALIEQGMKVFTAIYKRIFRALKEEFRLIFEINKQSLDVQKYAALMDLQMPGGMGPDGQPLPPQPLPPEQLAMDYQGALDIMPVADPNNVTDMQRMAKAQLALNEVKEGNPHVNPFEATKRAFEAARIEKVEELLIPPPPPDQPPPPTPEEIAAKAKIEAEQASAAIKNDAAQQQAQIKAESAMMALDQKRQQMEMDLAKKQADMVLAEQELALKQQAMMDEQQLREAELERRWRELEVKEAEMKMKHEAAEASSGADED